MSLSLSEKQELLVQLERAYFQGAKQIMYAGKAITYASADEMKRRINELKNDLSASGVGEKPARYLQPKLGKGV